MKKIVFLMLVFATFVSCQKDGLPERKEVKKIEWDKLTPSTPPREKVPVKKFFYTAISLQIQQSFWLNSATYLGSNKRTRASIPITLPEKTVALYYVVSVTDKKSDKVNIDLEKQLNNILKDYREKKLVNIASKIELPKFKTSSEVDVYLLDSGSNNDFLSKNAFGYYPSGSRKGFNNTIFEVFDISDLSIEEWIGNSYFNRRYFIGFLNPQTFDGENVNVEVVAVIKNEETVYEYK